MNATDLLPPLPSPDLGMPWRVNAPDGSAHSAGYTAEQMRAYAAQAVETMRAAFRDLNSANDKLLDENFALAAGQCANVTGDDGGTPQCAEIARLKGEVMRLHSELAKLRHD